jgi:hypothetical protein
MTIPAPFPRRSTRRDGALTGRPAAQTWVRLGPWQLVFWVTYERLRGFTGQQGF